MADAEQSAAPPIRDGAKRAYADLFTDPLDATAIGLAAVSTPDPQNPGKWQLHVRIDLHDIHLQRGGAQTSGVVEVALPIKGGINVRSFRIGLTDQQLASALSNGFSMMIPDVEVPGANLRLVVRDPATGLAGSVRIPLRN